jgi:hypothetical protein
LGKRIGGKRTGEKDNSNGKGKREWIFVDGKQWGIVNSE